jgi:hypothetical protein
MQPVPGPQELEPEWQERLRYWKRALGRIQLGVEPVEDQLEKYRRVTWVLTAVAAGVAIFFLSLFTAFRRPDIGAIVVLVLLVPMVAMAWLDFFRLKRRVRSYLVERNEHEGRGSS